LSQKPIRVLIVDDHKIARIGIRAALVDADDIELVGEACDGEEAVAASERLRPDVILMDLVMPGGLDGVEAIRAIRERQSDAKIVILTGTTVTEVILAGVQAGAVGFLDKTTADVEVSKVVRRAARGEPSFPPEITHKLLRFVPPTAAAQGHPRDLLTKSELAVLRQVAKGLTNQEIADEIHLAEGTVRTHMTHILSKLGVDNRVQAALYALRSGLASLADG